MPARRRAAIGYALCLADHRKEQEVAYRARAYGRATNNRKALRPDSVIAAMRLVGMTDKEIRAALERASAYLAAQEKKP